ncbi:hypothetical protein C7974DRAFT_414595 [Boeremia exigua]|uniref:uncharacterized protein n=1 Tax=Boeremia exigua TaxID=749465 RepID=UPI001E8E6BC6|nr:uncharacterized protein C7974DRAFT_414595 [Boeremia exigua]KAH6621913.1 hypothetical protein C7974DRAFT_414595 [Boeremia exigua]
MSRYNSGRYDQLFTEEEEQDTNCRRRSPFDYEDVSSLQMVPCRRSETFSAQRPTEFTRSTRLNDGFDEDSLGCQMSRMSFNERPRGVQLDRPSRFYDHVASYNERARPSYEDAEVEYLPERRGRHREFDVYEAPRRRAVSPRPSTERTRPRRQRSPGPFADTFTRFSQGDGRGTRVRQRSTRHSCAAQHGPDCPYCFTSKYEADCAAQEWERGGADCEVVWDEHLNGCWAVVFYDW